jgi:hypothetical protein
MAKQAKAAVIVTTLPTSYGYKNRWGVSGSAQTPYVVSLATDGNWACSCMAWTRTHPREDCKHIMRVKLQTAAPVVQAPNPSLALPTYSGRKMRD